MNIKQHYQTTLSGINIRQRVFHALKGKRADAINFILVVWSGLVLISHKIFQEFSML